MSEPALLNAIRLAVGSLPDVRLWRNNTGMLKDHRGVPVRYGLAVGSADLIGIVAPWGRMLSIEVKVPGKKPTSVQLQWAEVVRKFGGVAGWVTSIDGALELVREARGPSPYSLCDRCGAAYGVEPSFIKQTNGDVVTCIGKHRKLERKAE